MNSPNETLHEKIDELKNPQLTRKKFNSSRKERIHPNITAHNRAQNPVARKATVRGQEFDNPLDTFNSHDQETFENKFDQFRNT